LWQWLLEDRFLLLSAFAWRASVAPQEAAAAAAVREWSRSQSARAAASTQNAAVTLSATLDAAAIADLAASRAGTLSSRLPATLTQAWHGGGGGDGGDASPSGPAAAAAAGPRAHVASRLLQAAWDVIVSEQPGLSAQLRAGLLHVLLLPLLQQAPLHELVTWLAAHLRAIHAMLQPGWGGEAMPPPPDWRLVQRLACWHCVRIMYQVGAHGVYCIPPGAHVIHTTWCTYYLHIRECTIRSVNWLPLYAASQFRECIQ
jgi:hypothetical protein